MSEGELQIRLCHLPVNRDGKLLLTYGQAHKILDEAKADFPIDDDLIDDDHIFTLREELLRYHKLEHKRAVWFKKWFGATKQQ